MFLKRIAITACCYVHITCSGQHIRPISVGDTVKAAHLFSIVNSGTDRSLQFPKVKEELLILDFWATWCSSCVVSFPHLDSMQAEFTGKLKIILVNWDEPITKIHSFLDKYAKRRGKALGLPIIVGDTILRTLFPHQTLPHYAWIYKGKLLATTAPEMVTADRIAKVLANEPVSFKFKKDVMDFDEQKFLLEEGNGGKSDRQLFRSLFTRELEGLRGGYQSFHDSVTQRYVYVNFPVLGLYQLAYGFDYNRMILEVENPLQYAGAGAQAFSYELTAPASITNKKCLDIMRMDLDRYTGLKGRMERKLVDCYILTKGNEKIADSTGKDSKIWDNEDHSILFLRNFPFNVFFRDLNHSYLSWPLKPIIVDETGYKGTISIDLPAEARMNMKMLSKLLLEKGFILKKGRRVVEMFVLREEKLLLFLP